MRLYEFGDFQLDYELRRGDKVIPLQPKPRAVLRYLVEHAHRPVSAHELRAAVWENLQVKNLAVQQAICQVRKALGSVGLISCRPAVGYQIHLDEVTTGPVGSVETWHDFARHATGTAEERIAMADALTRAEFERFGA